MSRSQRHACAKNLLPTLILQNSLEQTAATELTETKGRDSNANSSLSWKVNTWVKEAILSGFRAGGITEFSWPAEGFFDRVRLVPRRFTLSDAVRMVPGGSAVRRGAHVSAGVVIMPPSYINIGAYIDGGTMVDSHVLVGSCAFIGKMCTSLQASK